MAASATQQVESIADTLNAIAVVAVAIIAGIIALTT
jgi:hypothetical protein